MFPIFSSVICDVKFYAIQVTNVGSGGNRAKSNK